jgi:hypothetical protein
LHELLRGFDPATEVIEFRLQVGARRLRVVFAPIPDENRSFERYE